MKATGIIFIVLAVVLFAGTAMAITQQPIPTPEPATIVLLSAGMIGLGIFGKKIKNRKNDDVRDLILKKTKGGFAMTRKNFLGNRYVVFILSICLSVIAIGGWIQTTNAEDPPAFVMSFGTSGSGNGQFNSPNSVAVDSLGNVYVVDTMNYRIQKFSSNGTYISQFGTQGTGNGQFNNLFGISVDSSGNIYVVEVDGLNRIQKFSNSGTYLSQIGSSGSGNGQFITPTDIAFDSSGNIYVVDQGNSRIQKFDKNGVYLSQFGTYGSGNGQFNHPFDIAIDGADNIWVADGWNERIQKFSNAGVYLNQFGTSGSGNGQFGDAVGIAVDSSGNIWVTDYHNNRIQKFSSSGVYLSQFGTQGSANGQLSNPHSVEVDKNGNIYVADVGNNRIQKFAYPANTYKLPDTGQTKCYNDTVEITCPSPGQDFYGQDAQYTINPPSYTKLDANGNALADSATSWVMVKDNVTGLIWENKTTDGSIHDASKTYTWDDAQNVFIAKLNATNFGGHNDWRMPDREELRSIADYSRYSPAINSQFFPMTQSSRYWSSSTAYYAGGNIGCYLNFTDGIDSAEIKSGILYVRAVRGDSIVRSFTDNGNGTITDNKNGLMWQQAAGNNAWKAALAYCENLSLAGYMDWRLPNIKELASLPNLSIYNPAIDTKYFPGYFSIGALSGYWSSTMVSADKAFYMNFNYGYDAFDVKYSSYYVRCVRGGLPSPTITAVTPNTGTTAGGTTVTITGMNFIAGATSVSFGGSFATVSSVSATQIICTTSAHAAGTVDVSVLVAGLSATKAGGFTYTTDIPTGTFIRALPSCYIAGETLNVTVSATPSSATNSYAVEDTPPSGWTVSNISNGGVFDSGVNKVKFGPFFDSVKRDLKYDLTPPASESGDKSINGKASSNGVSSDITGQTVISACQLYHPADMNQDFRIVMDELTAYGSAWKSGAAWSVPPNPIPIDYVIRAATIWKSGEEYKYDSSVGTYPLCWISTSTRSAKAFRSKTVRSESSAVRQMPAIYQAGQTITVSVAVTAASSVIAYGVEDQIPAGWTVSEIDNGGEFDNVNGKVKFGPFIDNQSRTLTYQVTPPADAKGIYRFSGTASFDGNKSEISGNNSVTDDSEPGNVDGNQTVDLGDAIKSLQVMAGLKPQNVFASADVNGDSRIGLEEVIYILQKVAGLR